MGGQGKVVAHHGNGEAIASPGVVEHLPEEALALEVDAGGRLVEHDERGLAEQCRGKQHAAHLSAREIAQAKLRAVRQADLLQRLARQGKGLFAEAEPEGPAGDAKAQELLHRHRRLHIEVQVLGNVAYAAGAARRKADGAGIGNLAQQAEQEGRLARAVGADEDRAAPLGEGGADPFQHGAAVKAHRQVAYSYSSSVHRLPTCFC